MTIALCKYFFIGYFPPVMGVWILLSQGKAALIDPDDFERLSQYRWCASLESRGTKFYAIRWLYVNKRRYKIRMHRFILGLPPGLDDSEDRVVDHLNHDSLDNRKSNLEIITQSENMRRSNGWKKKAKPYL